jgi:RHH-type proline utilization regulon transcriptional repressor/proline dehydrogenase/delta 1-pyrroline-5-carboxylate dehydrogenase
VSYLACAKALLAAPDAIYPQFATHNAATIAAILQMGAQSGAPFELQRLHGMGEGVYREVLKNPLIACRVYAPVGAHKDLLAYLVRRLLENGANSSFVHQLADESVGMDELLISPCVWSRKPRCRCRWNSLAHPRQKQRRLGPDG